MGAVIWITGLSGAGKSSTAEALVWRLRHHGVAALLIDGDVVRDIIRDPVIGHDAASRLTNAYRISRMAKAFAEQGLTVVVATMSLFHEIYDWNRRHLPAYFEVFVKAEMDTLVARDAKGLYHAARTAEMRHVGAVDLAVEFPKHPDLVIENNIETADRLELVERILQAYETRISILTEPTQVAV